MCSEQRIMRDCVRVVRGRAEWRPRHRCLLSSGIGSVLCSSDASCSAALYAGNWDMVRVVGNDRQKVAF